MEARFIRRSAMTMAVGLALGAAGTAQATNGYFAHGYGIKAKGMGGVGMAISQDAYAPGINPAGIAGMESRFDGALTYFRPERSYEVSGNPTVQPGQGFGLAPGEVESDSKNFFIPSLGFVQQIDRDRSWGIAFLGNGGMNTDYPAFENAFCPGPTGAGGQTPPTGTTGPFCDGSAGVNLEQLAIIPTYAQKFADGRVSVGFSPIISYQRFEAKGIQTFADFGASDDPENFSGNGTDDSWGYGAQIGIQAEVAEGVHLGANYRSKIRNSDFDDYAGLFAEGGSFDIPSTWGMGVAWEVTPTVTLVADYQRINYSDVDAISNSGPSLQDLGAAAQGQPFFGTSDGRGFGWDDINVYKIGAQFELPNDWQVRVGYNRGDNPIDSDEVTMNILAPGVMKHHYTAGFTKSFGDQHELSFAAMYAPSNSVSGANAFDPGQDIEIEMKQYELELGYSYRF
ncbi:MULTISPECIES: OmpP1/FadL family transporter [unclassified Thioalkalivibrio]|uniref:OmpP1/FadL family transporter n=1 Tax=unclassified Thioalkalivibrio TaxID=2621013 RepID=UPI0003821B80|nr:MULTISPECIES: outer membrane protein transport protein [unclassified Thioalkalivibrio]